ncbi:MAG: YitT family protein [Eubacteriaceae bacterium]|nr:YitT family protein [Eubacteriaceae bacterium]
MAKGHNIKRILRIILDYTMVTAGCFLMAAGFNMFCRPHMLAPGGFSGIAAVVFYLTGFPVGLCTLLLSVPWFIIQWRWEGLRALVRTLFGTVMFSVALDLTAGAPCAVDDILLASIFGGVVMGAAIGIVFTFRGTTGGTDLIAAVLHRRFSTVSSGMWLMLIDAAVIAAAGTVLGSINICLYSAITVYTTMKMVDLFENGFNNTRAFYIISEHNEEIKDEIFEKLERGATFIGAKGAYHRDEREILLCLVKRFQVGELKSIIRRIDPDAFVFNVEVSEVFGEGFTNN